MHMNKEAQILYFNRMNNLHLQMAEPPEEQAAMQLFPFENYDSTLYVFQIILCGCCIYSLSETRRSLKLHLAYLPNFFPFESEY